MVLMALVDVRMIEALIYLGPEYIQNRHLIRAHLTIHLVIDHDVGYAAFLNFIFFFFADSNSLSDAPFWIRICVCLESDAFVLIVQQRNIYYFVLQFALTDLGENSR